MPEKTQGQSQSSPSGKSQSKNTSLRRLMLTRTANAELQAAVQGCISGAVARGLTLEELAEDHLYGPAHFMAVATGSPTTITAAIEVARVCGYRLHVTPHVIDDEIRADACDLEAPFETASRYMHGHHALHGMDEDAIDELLRGALARYFGQMREKGYKMVGRG